MGVENPKWTVVELKKTMEEKKRNKGKRKKEGER